jgi:hypothetical protein
MIYKPENITWKLTRPFCRVGFSMFEGNVFIHCEIYNWNKTTLLESLNLWEKFKADLVEAGQSRIFSVIPSDDEKMNKFSRYFGFRLLKKYNGFSIYTQEIS